MQAPPSQANVDFAITDLTWMMSQPCSTVVLPWPLADVIVSVFPVASLALSELSVPKPGSGYCGVGCILPAIEPYSRV